MIPHSSFCNESVVISYGIVIAKVQTIPKIQKSMEQICVETIDKSRPPQQRGRLLCLGMDNYPTGMLKLSIRMARRSHVRL